ncbi:glycosyltransferase [Vibrio sp. 10N.261.55.F6]|uniref:glycosyltransferase n=1 Tax=Vibrio sp. 10N.261.55.F6 TaxID=3229693 RepID=UPI00354BBC26
MKNIAVVCPCFNEYDFVDDFVEVLANQSVFKRDEYSLHILFIDGQSNDGTYQKLLDINKEGFDVIINENKHVSDGLNNAINFLMPLDIDVLVRMDFHSVYPENYIEFLLDQFFLLKKSDPKMANIGVPIETCPTDDSEVSLVISKAMSSKFGVGGSDFRVSKNLDSAVKVDTVPFGCFDFEVFREVGCFDTELIRNQDDEFNLRLVRNGYSIYLIPGLVVKYYCRNSIKKMSKMFFQYGYFKPLVNKKQSSFSSYRQFIPSIFVLSLFACMMISFLTVVPLLTLSVVYSFFVLSFFISELASNSYNYIAFSRKFIISFLVLLSIHFSYGFGYINGALNVIFKFELKKQDISR